MRLRDPPLLALKTERPAKAHRHLDGAFKVSLGLEGSSASAILAPTGQYLLLRFVMPWAEHEA